MHVKSVPVNSLEVQRAVTASEPAIHWAEKSRQPHQRDK